MTNEATKDVMFLEGEEQLAIEDGQIAERGKPLTVSAELADRLCVQSIWTEVKDGKPVEPLPTPAAKEKAAEAGVDVNEVDGSGSGGKVTVDDVKDAAEAKEDKSSTEKPESPPPPTATVPPPSDARSKR